MQANLEEKLLEGFESDSDGGVPVTLPPVMTNKQKKLAKKAAKAAALNGPSTPGTIYLGHIPHGFFEPQMLSYFSQFGKVTRLRLSRNRRTGNSKHYGWVEFASKEVAEIVAETMDGYLIPPHRLVCKVVTVDENVWKGANKRFKRIDWRRINRERLEGKRTKETWETLVQKEKSKNEARVAKIKALGIDYEFPVRGDKRKATDAEPVQKKVKSQKTSVGKERKTKR